MQGMCRLDPTERRFRGVLKRVVLHAAETTDWPASEQRAEPKAVIPDSAPRRIGRFEIVRLLGEGTFGRVYEAHDPRLGRTIALKVPIAETVATPEECQRFLREARLAASVRHKNICPIHEVDEADGQPYIVMAYIPGGSLAQYLRKLKDPLTGKQVAVIVRKLAQALAKAHEAGVVHRDLKPANVLYDTEQKQLVLTDFGLARACNVSASPSTRSGVLLGTPAYMAPEQARSARAATPASDIFSLGVIFYELLTGKRPFEGQTPLETLSRILSDEPVPPQALRPSVAPALQAACLKALAKDPRSRFATMQELADAMTAFLQGQPDAGQGMARADLTIPAEAGGAVPKPGSFDDRSEFRRIEALFEELAVKNQEGTAAVVEAAVARQRIAPWKFLAGSVVGLGLIAGTMRLVLPGPTNATGAARIVPSQFYSEEDRNNPDAGFLVNNRPISREDLNKEITLPPGVSTAVMLLDGRPKLIHTITVAANGKASPPRAFEEQESTPPAKVVPRSEPSPPMAASTA